MAMLVYQRVIFWKSCAVHLPNMNNMDYLGMFTYVFAVLVRLWPITSQNQTGMCQNDSKCVKLAKICGLSLILDFLDSVPRLTAESPSLWVRRVNPNGLHLLWWYHDILYIYIYTTHTVYTRLYTPVDPHTYLPFHIVGVTRCVSKLLKYINISTIISHNPPYRPSVKWLKLDCISILKNCHQTIKFRCSGWYSQCVWILITEWMAIPHLSNFNVAWPRHIRIHLVS